MLKSSVADLSKDKDDLTKENSELQISYNDILNIFDAYLSYSCELKSEENNEIKEYYYECNEDGMDIIKLKFNFVIQGYVYQINAKDIFKKVGNKKK